MKAFRLLMVILFVVGGLLIVAKLMGILPLEWPQTLIPIAIPLAYIALRLLLAAVLFLIAGIIAVVEWAVGRPKVHRVTKVRRR